jgi:hypothetical protein
MRIGAVFSQNRPGARAVALVSDGGSLGRTRRIVRRVVQLGAQRSLDQSLLEGQHRSIDGFDRRRAVAGPQAVRLTLQSLPAWY